MDVRVIPTSERNLERHVFTRICFVEIYTNPGPSFGKGSKLWAELNLTYQCQNTAALEWRVCLIIRGGSVC